MSSEEDKRKLVRQQSKAPPRPYCEDASDSSPGAATHSDHRRLSILSETYDQEDDSPKSTRATVGTPEKRRSDQPQSKAPPPPWPYGSAQTSSGQSKAQLSASSPFGSQSQAGAPNEGGPYVNQAFRPAQVKFAGQGSSDRDFTDDKFRRRSDNGTYQQVRPTNYDESSRRATFSAGQRIEAGTGQSGSSRSQPLQTPQRTDGQLARQFGSAQLIDEQITATASPRRRDTPYSREDNAIPTASRPFYPTSNNKFARQGGGLSASDSKYGDRQREQDYSSYPQDSLVGRVVEPRTDRSRRDESIMSREQRRRRDDGSPYRATGSRRSRRQSSPNRGEGKRPDWGSERGEYGDRDRYRRSGSPNRAGRDQDRPSGRSRDSEYNDREPSERRYEDDRSRDTRSKPPPQRSSDSTDRKDRRSGDFAQSNYSPSRRPGRDSRRQEGSMSSGATVKPSVGWQDNDRSRTNQLVPYEEFRGTERKFPPTSDRLSDLQNWREAQLRELRHLSSQVPSDLKEAFRKAYNERRDEWQKCKWEKAEAEEKFRKTRYGMEDKFIADTRGMVKNIYQQYSKDASKRPLETPMTVKADVITDTSVDKITVTPSFTVFINGIAETRDGVSIVYKKQKTFAGRAAEKLDKLMS